MRLGLGLSLANLGPVPTSDEEASSGTSASTVTMGVSFWTPADDAGIKIWLQADGAVQGDTSSWPNAISGTPLLTAVAQATGAKRPTLTTINAIAALAGTGAASTAMSAATFTGGAVAQPYFECALVRPDAVNNGRNICDSGNATNRGGLRLDVNGTPQKLSRTDGTTTLTEATGSLATSSVHVVGCLASSTASELWTDITNTITGDAGTKSKEGLTMFSNQAGNLSGNNSLGDYLFYSGAPTIEQKHRMLGYLGHKYGAF